MVRPMKLTILFVVGTFFFLNVITFPPVMGLLGELTSPGFESTELDDLDPSFRKRLTNTVTRLKAEGYPVWVGSTWRSKERQVFYKTKGWSQTLNSMHRGGGEEPGKRRAKAADIRLNIPLIYLPIHAAFYHRLQKTALEEGSPPTTRIACRK